MVQKMAEDLMDVQTMEAIAEDTIKVVVEPIGEEEMLVCLGEI